VPRYVTVAIAVGALAAVIASACGNDGNDGAEDAALPAGTLLVPPERVGDFERFELQLAAEIELFDRAVVQPVRVEQTDAGVVVLITRDRAKMAEANDGRDVFADLTGPVIGLGPSATGSSDFEAAIEWPASEELAIEMASHDLTQGELEDLARHLTLGADGQPVLPTEPVGEIPGSLQTPVPGVVVGYSHGDVGDRMAVHPATPEVQAAYRALLIGRPREAPAVSTAASCCEPAIYDTPRTVQVGDREAIAGTITPYLRVLIVPGDPGMVLVGSGGLDDSELAAIAAAAEPIDIGEVRRIVERERAAKIQRLVDTVTASEAALGYEVLQRWDGDRHAAVLTFGTTARPDTPPGAPSQPTLCGVPAADTPAASCLPLGSPAVVQEAPGGAMSGLRWGIVDERVAAVRFEFPEGDVQTAITAVDVPEVGPVRVFHVLLSLEEQIALMAGMTPEDFASVMLVATDIDGRELARVRLLPDR
jgi:hypothetical protein